MSRRHSAEVEATISELERFGCKDHWVEAGGKHTKVYYIWKGIEKFLVCAQSGSDHRGPENARTEVRHALGVVGQKPTHDKSKDRKQERNEAPARRPEVPALTQRPDPFAKLATLLPKGDGVANTGVLIGAPPGEMRIEMIEITPDMARDWLHDNTKNRRLREARVNFLALAIARGEWKMTHQPIAFDENGVLLDGQHRLSAIVRAGMTVKTLVARNAPRSSFDVIDIGDRRSLADITGIGEKEASLLRWMTTLIFREYGKTSQVTPQQAERVWPYVCKAVRAMLGEAPSAKRYITVTPIMAAGAIRIVGGERQQYVLNTWRDLVTMNFSDLPPVAASFLKQVLEGSAKKRIADYQLFARAWYMFDEDNADIERLRIDDPANSILEAKGTLLAAMGLTIAPE